MTSSTNNEWIYDWNQTSTPLIPPGTRVLLNDETLRDGLQKPRVHDPSIEEKIEILHLMESLGIDSLNIGLPGAGPRAVAHTEALAREIATNRMKIRHNAAPRTVKADIRPIAEISQRVGIPIEAATFLGSSPIRRLVEDWTVEHLERTTEEAVKFAVSAGRPGMSPRAALTILLNSRSKRLSSRPGKASVWTGTDTMIGAWRLPIRWRRSPRVPF